jgi:hypothetical protein
MMKVALMIIVQIGAKCARIHPNLGMAIIEFVVEELDN